MYINRNKEENRNKNPKHRLIFGFTLAEVLITLAVLGVVAAMTVAVVIPNMKKARLEVQLRSFHSKINQALRASYVRNGYEPELPRSDYSYAQNVEWLETYLIPFMRVDSIEKCKDPSPYRKNAACVRLINGELFEFVVDYNGADMFYFPRGEWADIEKDKHASQKVFALQFAKRVRENDDSEIRSNNFIEPYCYKWNGNIKDLYNNSNYGCKKGKKKFFCAKIIEQNGWQIPLDYPW